MKISHELTEIKTELENSLNQWRWCAAIEINAIPPGHLATYGYIAKIVEARHGVRVRPRNIAWLRKRLYKIFTHDTEVPLHRIAKAGDVDSLADSEETQACNKQKREAEGSWDTPKWLI